MQCIRCEADTAVLDSRAAAMNTIRRRRECTACGHRMTTYESTVAPHVVLKHRLEQAARKRKAWAKMPPEARKAYKRREHLRAVAREEARATGESFATVYERWDCE